VDLDTVIGVGGDVTAKRSDRTHDVRRATGALEPRRPRTGRLRSLLSAVRTGGCMGSTALRWVVVEERIPVHRRARRHEVEQRPLEGVGEAPIAGGEQEPPGHHHRCDGRAGLAVHQIGRQFVLVTEGLTLEPGADRTGQVQLARAHGRPLPQRAVQKCSSPVSRYKSTTPASRYNARTACPTTVVWSRTGVASW